MDSLKVLARLKLAWEREIFTTCQETILGLEAHIEGKDEFWSEVHEVLKELETKSDETAKA